MNEQAPSDLHDIRPRVPEDEAYIYGDDAPLQNRMRVLKQDDTFAVFDELGDFNRRSGGADGLFYKDTRFLSRFVLALGRQHLALLSSRIDEENLALVADLANPDLRDGDQLRLPRETVHFRRTSLLVAGAMHTLVEIHNFGPDAVNLPLVVHVRADFADIFEVRGQKRPKRGSLSAPEAEGDRIRLGYDGLDAVRRETEIRFDPAPDRIGGQTARWDIELPPGGNRRLHILVRCRAGDDAPPVEDFDADRKRAGEARRVHAARGADLFTSNVGFNDWLGQSRADLHLLTTHTAHGPYPYAGTPWFSTPFGRDGIITALLMLWCDPGLARGVLAYLAANQATEFDPDTDAEPGKILHETRGGEMCALREMPFSRYYGSIDSTPLFLMLAHGYWRRTGDLDFIRSIWPNILAALEWIDRYGDRDGDGFLEYARRTPNGLSNQGWKDSADSITHADGSHAEAPIALVEVQAYAYAAKLGAAELAERLGDGDLSHRLHRAAKELQRQFEEAFWVEDIGTYALALDGDKAPCRVRSSNAGHALFCGIADPERAERVADLLLAPAMFTEWGIRTLASVEEAYNPMSYHNGSVWPHDNAMIAMGFGRYNLHRHLQAVLTGLFDASGFLPMRRLPELFCGFPRRRGEGPTAYPVACAPQAWAAASAFGVLGACLGIDFEPDTGRARLDRPILPPFLDEVVLSNLPVADRRVSVILRRGRDGAAALEGSADTLWI